MIGFAETFTQGWAVLELMGHRKRAGWVSEVEYAGAKLLRIDVPLDDNVVVTEFYGAAAIYALRPVTEEVAMKAAAVIGDPRPVHPTGYRLPAPEDQEGDEAEIDNVF